MDMGQQTSADGRNVMLPSERPQLQQSKSLLLEDLLMSDGEMSGSEGGEAPSEEDEDNPFASKIICFKIEIASKIFTIFCHKAESI